MSRANAKCCKPRLRKPYSTPFALLNNVRIEVNRLVTIAILNPINSSNWAAPVVPIRNGQMRLCADLKVDISQQIDINRYPIPLVEKFFYKLKAGEISRD